MSPLNPITMKISVIPQSRSARRMWTISGFPAIDRRCFGLVVARGHIRVPPPAARTTAFTAEHPNIVLADAYRFKLEHYMAKTKRRSWVKHGF